MAFKYLGMAFFPLAFCYCIYSVIYNEHKVVINNFINRLFYNSGYLSELVQLCSWLLLWISPDIWVHNDDTATVHQLQVEVCGPSTLENDDVQGTDSAWHNKLYLMFMFFRH